MDRVISDRADKPEARNIGCEIAYLCNQELASPIASDGFGSKNLKITMFSVRHARSKLNKQVVSKKIDHTAA
ncbi:hypothetical protein [Methylorubrum zatmanii]